MLYIKINNTGDVIRASRINFNDGCIGIEYNQDILVNPNKYRYMEGLVVEKPIPLTTLEVPLSITRYQLFMYLSDLGKLNAVKEMITYQDEKTQTAFENCITINRENQLMLGIAEMIGMNSDEIDAFYIEANRLY